MGTLSPGRMTTESPTAKSCAFTCVSPPSGFSLRAIGGARSSSLRKASEALTLTRASTQWPRLMTVMMAAASIK